MLGAWSLELLYNTLFKLELTSHSIAIAFTDDLIILTRGESVVKAESYMNLEMRKILEWSKNNKLKFNENKSKVMLVPQEKTGKKEIEIYLNNKILTQVNSIEYLGIFLIAN